MCLPTQDRKITDHDAIDYDANDEKVKKTEAVIINFPCW